MRYITVDVTGSPIIGERGIPSLRPGYVLVKPAALGLNPYDNASVDYGFAKPGQLLGCDFAGIVVEASDTSLTRQWKAGDRVCGMTRSTDALHPENGSFAEYICVKGDLMCRVPNHLSLEEAAAVGVASVTVGRTLFDKFGIPYPAIDSNGTANTAKPQGRQILIYGGSTCIGTMFLQLAKLSNLHILTTCSPTNFDLVRSYGADFVVDYQSPSAIEELIAHAKLNEDTTGPLTLCVDCVSQVASSKFCAQVLNPENLNMNVLERRYSAVLPWTAEMSGITKFETIGYSFLGERWEMMGTIYPAMLGDFQASKQFVTIVENLLRLRKIRPHPVDVRDGGLDGIIEHGLKDLSAGVSGKKIVYRM